MNFSLAKHLWVIKGKGKRRDFNWVFTRKNTRETMNLYAWVKLWLHTLLKGPHLNNIWAVPRIADFFPEEAPIHFSLSENYSVLRHMWDHVRYQLSLLPTHNQQMPASFYFQKKDKCPLLPATHETYASSWLLSFLTLRSKVQGSFATPCWHDTCTGTAVGANATFPWPGHIRLPALKQELGREPVKLPTAQRFTLDDLVLVKFSIESF